MIGMIRGTVLKIYPEKILIMTASGVGYEVAVTGEVLTHAQINKEIELLTLFIVRETEQSLYGFASESEKSVFEKCLTVSGVGPKLAAKIVSTPLNLLLAAIESGDIDFLKKIPGLGKKTAEKIVIEFRGKFDFSLDISGQSSAQSEAKDGLKALGYDDETIRKVLKNADTEMSAEELITYFLRQN